MLGAGTADNTHRIANARERGCSLMEYVDTKNVDNFGKNDDS
jgi:hypothetical protein